MWPWAEGPKPESIAMDFAMGSEAPNSQVFVELASPIYMYTYYTYIYIYIYIKPYKPQEPEVLNDAAVSAPCGPVHCGGTLPIPGIGASAKKSSDPRDLGVPENT